ncbi:MAG: hypothetical protein KDC27_10805 [Acidobacteria bacterium]|nr:hypothetical protein [Acidobacteriota bacterium]
MPSSIRRLIILAALLLTAAPFVAVEIPVGSHMVKNLLVARVLEAIDAPALATVAAGLMVIGLIVPIQLGGWWLAGPRTWAFGVMAAVAALQLSGRGRRLLVAAAFAVIVGSSVSNLRAARRVQQEFNVFLSGLDTVKPGSYILPLLRDPLFPKGGAAQHVPGVNKLQDPFRGISDAYVILRGGAAAYTFAYPSVQTNATALIIDAPREHQFWYKTNDKTPVAERYRGVGDIYDYVLVYTDAPELKQTLASETDLAFENGPLKIYRTRRAL